MAKGKNSKGMKSPKDGEDRVIRHAECELCGETEDKIYICIVCETRFCEYCGSPDDRICFNCLDEEEHYKEEYDKDIPPEPSPKAQRLSSLW